MPSDTKLFKAIDYYYRKAIVATILFAVYLILLILKHLGKI